MHTNLMAPFTDWLLYVTSGKKIFRIMTKIINYVFPLWVISTYGLRSLDLWTMIWWTILQKEKYHWAAPCVDSAGASSPISVTPNIYRSFPKAPHATRCTLTNVRCEHQDIVNLAFVFMLIWWLVRKYFETNSPILLSASIWFSITLLRRDVGC